jgi:hypothetical protein
MALADQVGPDVRTHLIRFDAPFGIPTIFSSSSFIKGTGSIDDEFQNLTSSASSLYYALADTIKSGAGAFTTTSVSGGVTIAASNTTGNATVEADGIKLFTTTTPATPVTITSSVSSTGSGGRLNILVNGTIYYQKVISGRTSIKGYYRCSIGWVEFGTTWQPGSNVLTPVSVTTINTGTSNYYSIVTANSSLTLPSISSTLLATVFYSGKNLIDRSYISTNNFNILSPLNDISTRKLSFDFPSLTWSFETLIQAAICSEVNEDFDALFFDKTSLSVACINILTKKLSLIVN